MNYLFKTFRNMIILLGVIVLVPMMTHYGIQLVNKPPQRPAYPFVERADFKRAKEWKAAEAQEKKIYNDLCEVWGKKFDIYQERYFYIALTAGLLFIITGVFLPIDFLSAGFIGGGLSSLAFGYSHQWGHMSDLIKFISLIGVLVLLVAAGFLFARKKQ